MNQIYFAKQLLENAWQRLRAASHSIPDGFRQRGYLVTASLVAQSVESSLVGFLQVKGIAFDGELSDLPKSLVSLSALVERTEARSFAPYETEHIIDLDLTAC
jgi:hypothetical protein